MSHLNLRAILPVFQITNTNFQSADRKFRNFAQHIVHNDKGVQHALSMMRKCIMVNVGGK